MHNPEVTTNQDDPLTPEFMAGFLGRLQEQVMTVQTKSVDILESMSIRFLHAEMAAISYPRALGAMRLEGKLLTLLNDPLHGEAARFYLNPPFWLNSILNYDKQLKLL